MTPTREEDIPADRQIVTTRVLNARRDLVWRVWTDPEHIVRWWGPTGFTTTTASMDVRPGGQWRFVMHGPDGRDYPNLITFVEIEAPARIVYRHGGEVGLEPVHFTTIVTFEQLPDAPDRTRIVLRSVFESAEAREFVQREYGADEGAKQTLARLAEHVEALAAGTADANSAPFVIRRVVKAPRDLVYRIWTEREHLEQWFGPKGCTLTVDELDLRVGGVARYAMSFPGAATTWGKWVFREVSPPERLEFVASFADADGNSVHAPFDPQWPLEMLTTVTLEPHAGIGNGTVITVQTKAHGASDAEQRTFDAGHDSMHGGWSGTFEVLDGYLAKP
jgi:uncharacterized protein YndB with AHSA1/START domain